MKQKYHWPLEIIELFKPASQPSNQPASLHRRRVVLTEAWDSCKKQKTNEGEEEWEEEWEERREENQEEEAEEAGEIEEKDNTEDE